MTGPLPQPPAGPVARIDGLTSVIVVAADSGPLLGACIDSALASSAPVEVVLVDNASADGEVDRVRSRHGHDRRLRVVSNPRNIGFGPAANVGAAHAAGDALLVLNPDCRLQATSVARMRAVLASDAAIGLLGVDVRDPDGTLARGNRRRDPLLRRALFEMTGLARLESRFPAFAGVEVRTVGEGVGDVETVEAVSGACMLLPRASFDRVGGFDEAYFVHVEDLDLCRRVRDAGWRVVVAHAIDVVHEQGSSSRSRPVFVMLHKHRGMWRYFKRHDPAARNLLLRAGVGAGLAVHAALSAVRLSLRRVTG